MSDPERVSRSTIEAAIMTSWLLFFSAIALAGLVTLIVARRDGPLNFVSRVTVLAVASLAILVTITQVREYRAGLAAGGSGWRLSPSGIPLEPAAPCSSSLPRPSDALTGGAAPSAVRYPYAHPAMPAT